MFANRFTALVDACSLASALKRNLLLTLAEAEVFRLRWSEPILAETERAIERILSGRGMADAAARAKRACVSMETAFQEALVADFDALIPACQGLPDQGDVHVLAAAVQAQAAIIVTENLAHFPGQILTPRNLEAKSADAFIADTLSLHIGRGVAAVRTMPERFRNPTLNAEELLLKMEAEGMTETVNALRAHIQSL